MIKLSPQMTGHLDFVKSKAVGFEPVGSLVTCSPAPLDTDIDYLVLVKTLEPEFVDGWDVNGSTVSDEINYIPEEHRFYSFSKNGVNLIFTKSTEFFLKFMIATAVAKELNLLAKADRITLFQAILYNNAPQTNAAEVSEHVS